eukprot:9344700-Pyramimonas_sp.AAC.2
MPGVYVAGLGRASSAGLGRDHSQFYSAAPPEGIGAAPSPALSSSPFAPQPALQASRSQKRSENEKAASAEQRTTRRANVTGMFVGLFPESRFHPASCNSV